MRFTITFILSSILVFGSGISDAASVTVDESFDIHKVNGSSYSSGFSFDNTIELPAGDHTIELRYNEYFESRLDDSHVYIKSEPFLVSFSINASDALVLTRPDFDDVDSARTFAKKPTVILKNANRIIAELTTEDVATNTPKTHLHVATPETEAQPSVVVKANESEGPNTLKMLHYWWQRASSEERALFKQHIRSQESQ